MRFQVSYGGHKILSHLPTIELPLKDAAVIVITRVAAQWCEGIWTES